jgi:hypothetical protein
LLTWNAVAESNRMIRGSHSLWSRRECLHASLRISTSISPLSDWIPYRGSLHALLEAPGVQHGLDFTACKHLTDQWPHFALQQPPQGQLRHARTSPPYRRTKHFPQASPIRRALKKPFPPGTLYDNDDILRKALTQVFSFRQIRSCAFEDKIDLLFSKHWLTSAASAVSYRRWRNSSNSVKKVTLSTPVHALSCLFPRFFPCPFAQ